MAEFEHNSEKFGYISLETLDGVQDAWPSSVSIQARSMVGMVRERRMRCENSRLPPPSRSTGLSVRRRDKR